MDKPRRKAEWKPSQVEDVKLAEIKKEYFDASDKKPLELISDKDYDKYPHSKYMLPSEQDIQNVVTGEAPGVGNYALSSDEVVDYFINDRKGKQGVKSKVLDVLARKTKVIKDDESNSLKWIY